MTSSRRSAPGRRTQALVIACTMLLAACGSGTSENGGPAGTDPTDPATSQSVDTAEPVDATQPDITQPDTTEPDTTEPDITEPDTTMPVDTTGDDEEPLIDTTGFLPAERPTVGALADRFDTDSVTLVEIGAYAFDDTVLGEPIITTEGTPCATAADADACRADLDRLLAAPLVLPVLVLERCVQCAETRWSIVVTAGSGATAIEPSAAREIFTPVRSALDVSFIRSELVRVKLVEGGWEFVTSGIVSGCPLVERVTLWSMSTDGDVVEQRSIEVATDEVCI